MEPRVQQFYPFNRNTFVPNKELKVVPLIFDTVRIVVYTRKVFFCLVFFPGLVRFVRFGFILPFSFMPIVHPSFGSFCYFFSHSHGTIPLQFQYFMDPTSGGLDPILDYCPVKSPYSNGDCQDSSHQSPQESNYFGQEYHIQSICLTGDLIWEDYIKQEDKFYCYRYNCTSGTTVQISAIDNNGEKRFVACGHDEQGVRKSMEGFSGTIACPDYNLVCSSAASVTMDSPTVASPSPSNAAAAAEQWTPSPTPSPSDAVAAAHEWESPSPSPSKNNNKETWESPSPSPSKNNKETSGCFDDDDADAWLSTYACSLLAGMGWCASTSEYSVETNNRCPALCGQCTPNCFDDNGLDAWLGTYVCSQLAEMGWCASTSEYSMETNNRCPASCGKCKEQQEYMNHGQPSPSNNPSPSNAPNPTTTTTPTPASGTTNDQYKTNNPSPSNHHDQYSPTVTNVPSPSLHTIYSSVPSPDFNEHDGYIPINNGQPSPSNDPHHWDAPIVPVPSPASVPTVPSPEPSLFCGSGTKWDAALHLCVVTFDELSLNDFGENWRVSVLGSCDNNDGAAADTGDHHEAP